MDICPYAEWRVFYGKEDSSSLEVNAAAIYTQVFPHSHYCVTLQIFRVIAVATIVHIVQAKGQSKEHPIVKVAA